MDNDVIIPREIQEQIDDVINAVSEHNNVKLSEAAMAVESNVNDYVMAALEGGD